MSRLCQQRPDTLLVIFVSKVLETAIPQTSPVQRTKKMLVDLEEESEKLGNQMIFSSAWGSPGRHSVDLLCTKLVHDLPVKVLLPSFVPALGYDWKYLCSAPLSPPMPPGPPSSPGHAAKAGFALAPIPPAPLPPSSGCFWATTAPRPPRLQIGRNSSNPRCSPAKGSSLSSLTLRFPDGASTTERSSWGGYCCQENTGFNNSEALPDAVPIAVPKLLLLKMTVV